MCCRPSVGGEDCCSRDRGPHQEDNDSSEDVNSNPDASLVLHPHAHVVGVHNIQSVVTIVLEQLSTHYKRWCALMLLMLCCYALDDQVLSNVVGMSTYWATLDNIVLTWILVTLRRVSRDRQ
jgi:hypothetical protein